MPCYWICRLAVVPRKVFYGGLALVALGAQAAVAVVNYKWTRPTPLAAARDSDDQ